MQANGLDPPADRASPAPLPLLGGATVAAVAAGEYYGLAALRGGGVLAWGAAVRSQTPVRVGGLPSGRRVVALAAGYQHALASVDCGVQ